MRVTFVSMCAVLALSLAVCTFSMLVQYDALDELNDKRSQALEMLNNEQFDSAEEKLVELANIYKEKTRILELLASHDDLHDGYSHIVDAQVSLECEDKDDAYQALTQLGEMLEHMRTYESLNIANLY